MHSENINELAAALAKAQGEITGALKDSNNPFFKSKYADLAACWDACRSQLSKNGLAVIQTTEFDAGGGVSLTTTLVHSSGQWIAGHLPVRTKDDGPQAQGSGLTYARRYALAAIVGLAQIDDDAEAAQGRKAETRSSYTKSANKYAEAISTAIKQENEDQVLSIWNEAANDSEEFGTAVWALLSTPVRNKIKDLKGAK